MNPVFMYQAGHRLAAQVDKRARPGEHDLLAFYFSKTYSGPALSAVKPDRMESGEMIEALEANIVAITGVRLARIPEADYEFHCFVV
jgi:hypothetical protein